MLTKEICPLELIKRCCEEYFFETNSWRFHVTCDHLRGTCEHPNKEFSQRIFEQVLNITQVCRIGGPVKPGLLITLLLSPNWNSNYKIFSSMVVVRTRWYMSGKETYSAWKTKWPIFATQTNVHKSSLCAQYHLFQHSAQDLLRLSSMIFL